MNRITKCRTVTATKPDPISEDADAECRRIVAELAMIDARELANRAISYALVLRSLGVPLAESAADTFEKKAAELRDLERAYASAAGVADDDAPLSSHSP